MSCGRREQIGWSAKAKLQRGEPFEKQHRPVASRTRPGSAGLAVIGGCLSDWLCRRCSEQPKAQREKRGTIAGAEEAEVANAHEAFREDMQQEPSQELMHVQAHKPLFVFICRVAPAEGNLIVGKRHEPVIRDGNSMRIATEIAEGMFRSR